LSDVTLRIVVSAVLAALALPAGPAHAGPLAEALAKHDARAVDWLRGQRQDLAARCTLGAVYARRRDLPRAHLYLEGCADAELPDEIARDVATTLRDVTRQLRDGDLSSVEILTRPEGLAATITALPDETVTTPARVWVKAGTYDVQATTPTETFKQTVIVSTRSRAVVLLEAPPRHTPTGTKDGRVDFTEENATETQTQGPPPAVKHPSLLPDKYRRRVASGAPLLDDPLAVRTRPRTPRRTWLGLRVGAGMFDDAATDARIAGVLAATARHTLAPRWFLAGRLDYSRRGGTSDDALDTLGASAGLGANLTTGAVGLAAIAQLRGDLRFASTRATMDVARVGASAALGLEVTLPGSPLAAGIRFEHGLTELVDGTRDRALLLEVGVDLR